MQHFVALFRLRLFLILLLHLVPICLVIALGFESSVRPSDDCLVRRLPAGVDGSRPASVRSLFFGGFEPVGINGRDTRRRAEETRAKF